VKTRSAALGLLLAVSVLIPDPVHAQRRLVAPAVGAVLGTGAGGYVALSIVALQARRGTYLFNLSDFFGWESAAVLAGGGTGIILGFWDEGRLLNTVAATTAFGLVGTGVGALVGREIWPAPEGKWAGGVIGGGAGILLGAAVGVLLPPDFIKEEDGGIPILIRVPVGG
jgi:hypothetical protein